MTIMLRRVLPRPLLFFFFAYMTMVGATYNGLLTPDLRWQALTIVCLMLVIWWLTRIVGRQAWPLTGLESVFGLAALAFAGAFIFNLEDARRMSTGMWFMLVYGLLAYVLHDLIARRIIRRAHIVDALLIAGALIIALGLWQARNWPGELPSMLAGSIPFALPRPVSALGNSNTLAAVLAMLLPLAFALALYMTGVRRIIAVLYCVVAGGLLVLTYSRGGWLGGLAGLAACVGLVLAGYDVLAGWRGLTRRHRMLIGGLAVVVFIVAGLTGFVLVRSLDESGRGLGLRTFLYDTALRLFQEQPIFGQGIFTFGGGLARLNSTPPTEPHSHAHNIVLHVAAELGIVGLIVLSMVIFIAGRRALWAAHQRAESTSERRERIAMIGAGGALAAALVHHLLDVPAMNPAVALIVLVCGVMVVPISNPRRIAGWGGRIMTVGTGVLIMVVIGFAVWNTTIYQAYYAAIAQAAGAPDDPVRLREAARAVEAAAQADPMLVSYQAQAGMLWAQAGDIDAAIDAYRRTVDYAPEYAYLWANLGALHTAAGDHEAAFAAYEQAADRAPRAAWFRYLHGQAAERLGLNDEAYAAYAAALQHDPDLQLLPNWTESPIRDQVPLPPLSDLALLLSSDGVQPADAAYVADQQARLPITLNSVDADQVQNIDYIQFLTYSLPRRMVPQMNYPTIELAILHPPPHNREG